MEQRERVLYVHIGLQKAVFRDFENHANLSLEAIRAEGFFKYCLNRSSKACPMVFMTSWATPLGHSSMWQAKKNGK